MFVGLGFFCLNVVYILKLSTGLVRFRNSWDFCFLRGCLYQPLGCFCYGRLPSVKLFLLECLKCHILPKEVLLSNDHSCRKSYTDKSVSSCVLSFIHMTNLHKHTDPSCFCSLVAPDCSVWWRLEIPVQTFLFLICVLIQEIIPQSEKTPNLVWMVYYCQDGVLN